MKLTMEDKDEQPMCDFVFLFVIIIGYQTSVSPVSVTFAEW
jgi:hypothetical protein